MPNSKRPKPKKRVFTPAQANAMLPLLRSILRDVTTLAHEMHDRQEHLQSTTVGAAAGTASHREETVEMEAEFERGQQRMHDYLEELENLGIELKDPFTGLVDFRAQMDGREVYLCWRMEEAEVGHWHELESGFAGRQKLMTHAASH